MKSMRLTEWSKEALKKGLPYQWLTHKSKVIDISFSPECSDVMVLQGRDMFTRIDLREVGRVVMVTTVKGCQCRSTCSVSTFTFFTIINKGFTFSVCCLWSFVILFLCSILVLASCDVAVFVVYVDYYCCGFRCFGLFFPLFFACLCVFLFNVLLWRSQMFKRWKWTFELFVDTVSCSFVHAYGLVKTNWLLLCIQPIPNPDIKLFDSTRTIQHSHRKRKMSETREEEHCIQGNNESEQKSFVSCRKYQVMPLWRKGLTRLFVSRPFDLLLCGYSSLSGVSVGTGRWETGKVY